MICLKVPVGPNEEDLIFEYLNILVSRPDLARAMGARAKAWVETECSWSSVAERYVKFLGECAAGVAGSTEAPLPDEPAPLKGMPGRDSDPLAPVVEEQTLAPVAVQADAADSRMSQPISPRRLTPG